MADSKRIYASDGFFHFLDTLSGKKYRTLSQEEEATLFEEIKEGNQEALNRVVNAYLRFVVKMAYSFATHSISSVEELFQEGCLALTKAAKSYDANNGAKFITYADTIIMHKMYDLVAKDYKSSDVFSSYDDYINDQGDTKAEKLFDEYDKRHVYDIDRNALHQALVDSVGDRLDASERFIITNQFGVLEGEDNVQVQQIAEQLSLSTERIRQKKIKALQKLRQDDRLCSLSAA